jgi:hypothetical protein
MAQATCNVRILNVHNEGEKRDEIRIRGKAEYSPRTLGNPGRV